MGNEHVELDMNIIPDLSFKAQDVRMKLAKADEGCHPLNLL